LEYCNWYSVYVVISHMSVKQKIHTKLIGGKYTELIFVIKVSFEFFVLAVICLIICKLFFFAPTYFCFETYKTNWGKIYRIDHSLIKYILRRVWRYQRDNHNLVFSGVRVTRSLVLCVMFVDRCLSFCPLSFHLCVVCPSIYRLWLSLWYLQTLLSIYLKK
jgi:hypothetical protein